MSYFYICPTERVLDTPESPNPGAVCPDRAQRAGWERQGYSTLTDGSHRSTTTCTHKYMQGKLELHRSSKDREVQSLVRSLEQAYKMTTTTFYLFVPFWFLQYKPLLHVEGLRQRVLYWLQSSYSEIPPGAVWRRKRRGFSLRRHDGITSRCDLRRHKIQSRLDHWMSCFLSLQYFMRPLWHGIIEKVLRSQRGDKVCLNLICSFLGCWNY